MDNPPERAAALQGLLLLHLVLPGLHHLAALALEAQINRQFNQERSPSAPEVDLTIVIPFPIKSLK